MLHVTNIDTKKHLKNLQLRILMTENILPQNQYGYAVYVIKNIQIQVVYGNTIILITIIKKQKKEIYYFVFIVTQNLIATQQDGDMRKFVLM